MNCLSLITLMLVVLLGCMLVPLVDAGIGIRVYQDSKCAGEPEFKAAANNVCSVDFDNVGQSFMVACTGAAWSVTEYKNTTSCTNPVRTQTYAGNTATDCIFDKDHSYVKVDCNAIIMRTFTDATCQNPTDNNIMTPTMNQCTNDFDNPGQSFQLSCNGAAWSVTEFKNTSTCMNPVKTQTYAGTTANDCIFDKDRTWVKVDCGNNGNKPNGDHAMHTSQLVITAITMFATMLIKM